MAEVVFIEAVRVDLAGTVAALPRTGLARMPVAPVLAGVGALAFVVFVF